MSNKRFSQAYVEHLRRGPFAGRVDPWAEIGRYFHQIHNRMITFMQDALADELNERGYLVGRETSLQVFANRQPDLYVSGAQAEQTTPLEYTAVADALDVDSGVAIVDEHATGDLEALQIVNLRTNQLVTVVEIISPSNKTHPSEIATYLQQRHTLFLSRGVNVVEIDATRSVKRLLSHQLTRENAYHVAVHLPADLPRVLVSQYNQPLPAFALPLDVDGVRVNTQSLYDMAYQRGQIAAWLHRDLDYAADALPFPSLLTESQKAALQQTVATWRAELDALNTLDR